MKTINQYTKTEIQVMVCHYNALVKPSYRINEGWIKYILTETVLDPVLDFPYYEIQANETLSGHREMFKV